MNNDRFCVKCGLPTYPNLWDLICPRCKDEAVAVYVTDSFSRPFVKKEQIEKPVKLNIGCRNKPLPSYINIDINENNKYADVIDNGFELEKFDDESVDLIEFTHGLEHLNTQEVKLALETWYKKLKVGGIVRVSVPDMEKCSALLLLTGDKNLVKSMFYGSQIEGDPYDLHKSLHTKKSLTEDLTVANFRNIKEWDWALTWPHNYVDSFASCYYPHFRKNYIMDNGKRVDLGGVCLSLNLEATK